MAEKLRMSLIEVEEVSAPFFSAARQTEDDRGYTVFTLDPPEQEGIDYEDPEEGDRLVVLTETAFRGFLEEVSVARRAARDAE